VIPVSFVFLLCKIEKKGAITYNWGIGEFILTTEQGMTIRLVNDEPVSDDGLGRKRLIEGLTAAIGQCDPPLVIAVDGGWGRGKTSMLKCLEKAFKDKKDKSIRTAWFSPWQFQFEEAPAVSLLQVLRETLREKTLFSIDRFRRKSSKLLKIVGTMAGEMTLKALTGFSVKSSDIVKEGWAYEKEYFEVKQLTTRMQEEFGKAIEELLGKDKRLVIFIDDLDRCRPANALRLLEALKLYLNAPGCVYVAAIDMDNLAQNLAGVLKTENPRDYLEKIFQLVYTLPQPTVEVEKQMVKTLLGHHELYKQAPPVLARVENDLAALMGDNPRQLKLFCNRFLLESAMLKAQMGDTYDAACHMFLQILQHCFPSCFRLFKQEATILGHENPKKDFDVFISKWLVILEGKLGALVQGDFQESPVILDNLEAGLFLDYLQWLPCRDNFSPGEKSAREKDYTFVTINIIQAAKPGILCLENHSRNEKIKSGSNLSEYDDLSSTILRHLNFSNCDVSRCNFDNADFSGSDLSYADGTRSSFKQANFKTSIAQETVFKGADMKGVVYEGGTFPGADFQDAERDKDFEAFCYNEAETMRTLEQNE